MVASAPNNLANAILNQRARLILQEKSVEKEVGEFIAQVLRRWLNSIRQLARTRGNLTASQLDAIVRQTAVLDRLGVISDDLLKAVQARVQAHANRIGKSEGLRTAASVDDYLEGVSARLGIEFGGINIQAVRAALAGPIAGATIVDGFKKIRSSIQAEMRRDLAQAIADGWTLDDLADKWAKGRGAGRIVRDTKSLAQTAMMAAANNGHLATYRESKATVAKVGWLATFDVRTCPVCGARHGHEYFLNEAPAMPAHLRCRCVWLPIFADERLNQGLGRLQAYQRPDGAVVFREADRSFEAWLRKQPYGIQQDFFGSDFKWDVWRKGLIRLDQVVTVDGRILRDAEVQRLVRGVTEGATYAKSPGYSGIIPPETTLPLPFGEGDGPGLVNPIDAVKIGGQKHPNKVAAREVLEAMGAVHQVPRGSVVKIAVETFKGEAEDALGFYDPKKVILHVNKTNEYPRLTTAHEFFHFLDDERFAINGTRGSRASPDLNKIVEVARETPLLKAMEAERNRPDISYGYFRFLDYQLRPNEILARSYAQWIARKTGDRAMLEELQQMIRPNSPMSAHWPEGQFDPIAEAWDTLMRQLGWMK